jgi:hypothetical protein
MPGTDWRGMRMLGPQTLGTMHRAMMGMTDGATMPRHMMKITSSFASPTALKRMPTTVRQ